MKMYDCWDDFGREDKSALLAGDFSPSLFSVARNSLHKF
jgi:hypothetical protein